MRWLHDPEAEEGFVGATLSSEIGASTGRTARGRHTGDRGRNVEQEGWPLPGGVPGLITDIVVSMDDRFLYFSNGCPATSANTTSQTPPTHA